MAGVRRFQDLHAWQLAEAFSDQVTKLLKESPAAWRDLRFRGQLVDAAGAVPADICEGFLRFSPAHFCLFLDYGLASLGEAERHLHRGIRLGYFEAARCESAFRLAKRCLTACVRLKQSQQRYLRAQEEARKQQKERRRRRRN